MFLGIDLGTGSVKAILLDANGGVISEASRSYTVYSPHPGWAENRLDDWWQATVEAVQECTQGKQVAALGFSGQSHGIVLCDRSGKPLRNAILWADTRSIKQLESYQKLSLEDRFRLANPIVTGMAGVSLLWIKNHESKIYNNAKWVLTPKDWLRFRLTGEAAVDHSDASMTLMYDLVRSTWASDILERLQLRRDWLPDLVESDALAGTLSKEAAEELSLRPGIPVAAGCCDTAAALLGNGFIKKGEMIVQIGTAMQIITLCEQPEPDPTGRTHLYRATGKLYFAMAAMQNGGIAFEWVRKFFSMNWQTMYAEGFSVSAGSEGVTFLPYLTGERTPHLNPHACGSWQGLKLGHERAHLICAVFEGIAFALKEGLQALQQKGVDAESLYLSGGGARDSRWLQLLSDILEKPLSVGQTQAGSARGAALLAGLAVDHWKNAAETTEGLDIAAVVATPRKNLALSEAFERFQNMYKILNPP
jgi:xylulokinase